MTPCRSCQCERSERYCHVCKARRASVKLSTRRERFRGCSSFVEDSGTGCWNWTGRVNREGYGPHRAAYELFKGPVLSRGLPSETHLDHLCRNRACVNPWHLQPVTPRENAQRGRGTRWPVPNMFDVFRGGALAVVMGAEDSPNCQAA
jgi:hypothetical protein